MRKELSLILTAAAVFSACGGENPQSQPVGAVSGTASPEGARPGIVPSSRVEVPPQIPNSPEVALALDYWQAMLKKNISRLAKDQGANVQDPMYQNAMMQNIAIYDKCDVGVKGAQIVNKHLNDTTVQIDLAKSCQVPLGGGTSMTANKIYIIETIDQSGKLVVAASPTPLP